LLQYLSISYSTKHASELLKKRVNWQPISALSLIGSMIDSLLDEMENHYANLQACGRVIQVYSAQADDVWLFETQLYRWRNLNLTPAQREEVDRLAVQIPTMAFS
jgi:hypothetical protein